LSVTRTLVLSANSIALKSCVTLFGKSFMYIVQFMYKLTRDYHVPSVVVWKYYKQYRRLQRWSNK